MAEENIRNPESNKTGVISSVANPGVKQVVKLRKRSYRDESGLMIIEGNTELQRAIDAGYPFEKLYFCPALFRTSFEQDILQRCDDNKTVLIECTIPVFNKISYRDNSNGLLAVAPQIQGQLSQIDIKENMLVVVAESIEKSGNLGAIMRSADATGVDVVIVCDRCTDINNPNVIRASIGTIFTVPVVETDSMTAINWLRDNNIKILAATPEAEVVHYDVDMSGSLAIAVGSEKPGLSKLWLDIADIRVKIPMLGKADSLNVSASATVLLYEALRIRVESN